MLKKFKLHISVFLILLAVFFSFAIKSEAKQLSRTFIPKANNVNLFLDSPEYNVLPKEFRKASILINAVDSKNLLQMVKYLPMIWLIILFN